MIYWLLAFMNLVVVLDNIRSAHNVGSIFRTADALGVSRLYLCGITPVPDGIGSKANRDIAKTALGAERAIPWERRARVSDAIKQCRKDGYQVVALEQDPQSVDIRKFFTRKNVALILGEEVSGIKKRILNLCDTIVEIPMLGSKESLNVSVAFGVAGYSIKFRSFSP